jgi:hypothetical protein
VPHDKNISHNKHQSPTPTVDNYSTKRKSKLLFVYDHIHNVDFLIDTGASISVVPPRKTDLPNAYASSLRAANGTPITLYGERLLTLTLGLRREFTFIFYIADVSTPIVGLDFLSHFNLIVNPAKRIIIDPLTDINTVGISSPFSTGLCATYPPEFSKYHKLLDTFPTLCSDAPLCDPPKHNFKLYLPTEGVPVTCKARRMGPKLTTELAPIIQKMRAERILLPSKSEWGSPIHAVKKKNGTWRIVGDYRLLNNKLTKDNYPLPFLQNFSMQLAGKSIFSTVDLKDAFLQIPINEDDKEKTSISTPWGSFYYSRMPFGTKRSANTFQRFVDEVLRDLIVTNDDGTTRIVDTFAYIDDILIASSSPDHHLADLHALFTRLAEYDLRINTHKCEFGRSHIIFLGHEITPTGIRPIAAKVDTIANFSKPTTCEELRRFLGVINFYRRFIPHAAETFAPLNDLLQGKKKFKKTVLHWTETASAAFLMAKESLKATAELSFPDYSLPTALVCDASLIATGAVLQQKTALGWKPIGFFSRKLHPRETKYSAFSRELLALFLSVKHFAYYLRGIEFSLHTDHKPLVPAFKMANQRDNAREARHLSFVSEFTTDIQYIPGSQNIVADALSRDSFSDAIALLTPADYLIYDIPDTVLLPVNPLPVVVNSSSTVINCDFNPIPIADPHPVLTNHSVVHSPVVFNPPFLIDSLPIDDVYTNETVHNYERTGSLFDVAPSLNSLSAILKSADFADIARSQYEDDELRELIQPNAQTNLKLEPIDGVIYDVSMNTPRIFVPKNMRRKLFDNTHNISHPSHNTTLKLINDKFVFPHMSSTIKEWCKACIPCQKSKIIRHTRSPISNIQPKSDKFSQVHIDIVGPLPPVEGYRYLLTMIDRYSRWPEVVPLQNITAITVARAFVEHWISRFGVPFSLSTDRGAQFEAHLFNQLTNMLGCVRIRTTSYHASGNGLIERMHRSLKTSLRAQDQPFHWLYKLPLILLLLRTSIKEDLHCSSSDLLYGCPLNLPSNLIAPATFQPCTDPTSYAEQLRMYMSTLSPAKSRHLTSSNSYVHPDLKTCQFVFIRDDAVRPPLTQPYKGPYKVLDRANKYFKLQLQNRIDTVNIDRLKPAFLEQDIVENLTIRNTSVPLQTTSVTRTTQPKPVITPALPVHIHTVPNPVNTTALAKTLPTAVLVPITDKSNVPDKQAKHSLIPIIQTKTITIRHDIKPILKSKSGRTINTPLRFES